MLGLLLAAAPFTTEALSVISEKTTLSAALAVKHPASSGKISGQAFGKQSTAQTLEVSRVGS